MSENKGDSKCSNIIFSNPKITLIKILTGLDNILQKNLRDPEPYEEYASLFTIVLNELIKGDFDIKNVLDVLPHMKTVNGMQKLCYQLYRCILIFNSKLNPFNVINKLSSIDNISRLAIKHGHLEYIQDMAWYDDNRTDGGVFFRFIFDIVITRENDTEKTFECSILIPFMISPNTDSNEISETYRIIVYKTRGTRGCVNFNNEKAVLVYNHDENTFSDVLNELKNIILAMM